MKFFSAIRALGLLGWALSESLTIHVVSLEHGRGNCLLIDHLMACSNPEALKFKGIPTSLTIDNLHSYLFEIGVAHNCYNILTLVHQAHIIWSTYIHEANIADVYFRDDQCFWTEEYIGTGDVIQDSQGNRFCYADQIKKKKWKSNFDTNPFFDQSIDPSTDRRDVCGKLTQANNADPEVGTPGELEATPESPFSSSDLGQNVIPSDSVSTGEEQNLLSTNNDNNDEDFILDTRRKSKRGLIRGRAGS